MAFFGQDLLIVERAESRNVLADRLAEQSRVVTLFDFRQKCASK